jgi:hypothetical protein
MDNGFDPQLFDVYLDFVRFSDNKGGKQRPLVVINEDKESKESLVLVLSTIRSERDHFSRGLFVKFMYKIKDYFEAGFDKQSYVNIAEQLEYDYEVLSHKTKIGHLSERDSEELIEMYLEFIQSDLAKLDFIDLYDRAKDSIQTNLG